MYIGKDNFPINYEGILGNDFLRKYNVTHDYKKGRILVGQETFALQPYRSKVSRNTVEM